jgi:ribosomal protein S18 acetylase RimI-like enzyme
MSILYINGLDDDLYEHLIYMCMLLNQNMGEEGMTRDDFIEKVNQGDYHFLLKYKEGNNYLRELLGLLVYIEYSDDFYIMAIVSKEGRRGIGSELLREMKKRTDNKDKGIFCKIRRDNEVSRVFFEKNGFRREEDRKRRLNRGVGGGYELYYL